MGRKVVRKSKSKPVSRTGPPLLASNTIITIRPTSTVKVKDTDLGLFDGKANSVSLGIDQSLTNYAISAVNEDKAYLWLLQPKTTGIDRLESLLSASSLVFNILRLNGCRVSHICMEGYAHGAKNQRESAGEVGAITKLILRNSFEMEVGYPTIVSPPTLKKFVTGKGNVKKNEILLGVYKKWGVELNNDNLADAYGLAKMAEAVHSGVTEYKYEAEVIESLHRHTEWVGA